MSSYHRIVLMRFAQPLTDAEEHRLRELLDAVVSQVAGVREVLFGANDADSAYTHGLHVTFDSRQAHEAYGPHPAHKELGAYLRSKGLEYELLLLAGAPPTRETT